MASRRVAWIVPLLALAGGGFVHGQPYPCENGVQDGSETDVDCGGTVVSTCPPGTPPWACRLDAYCDRCADGRRCKRGTDCQSGRCRPSSLVACVIARQCDGTCTPPMCPDGVRNGQETDVDCGGPACRETCGDGQGCASGTDCESTVCTDGICRPACVDDGVRNGAETGVDCGGPCRRCGCAAGGTPCTIFVTSTVMLGDFGGHAGADAICNERAKAAGRDGRYQAWICDGHTDPARRSTRSATQYVRTDGSLVAQNWGDLIDGWIDNPIHYDEFGKSIVLDGGFFWWTFFTWTHVKHDGTCDDASYLSPGTGPCPIFTWCPTYCADPADGRGWTSRSPMAQGTKGDVARHDGGWTDAVTGLCSDPYARLYCIEQ